MHLPSQSVTSPGWAHASCPWPDRIVGYDDQRIEAAKPPRIVCKIAIAVARVRSPHALGAGGAPGTLILARSTDVEPATRIASAIRAHGPAADTR